MHIMRLMKGGYLDMKRTYKQIEASRNARLWITTVVMPAAMFGLTLYNSNPEMKHSINEAFVKGKAKVKDLSTKAVNKLTKKEEH